MIKLARFSAIATLLLVLGWLDLFASHGTSNASESAKAAAERPRVAGIQSGLPGGGSSDGRYDLRSRKILTQVILLIKENYVDPSRVKPYDMLLASLDYIEKSVAEILIDETGAPDKVKISVGGAQREFDLTITYAWEIGYKLRDVFEFIQENISSEQDLKDIEYAAINGMLSTLDPHSVLLKPENFEEMKTSTKGEFGGLGISITIKDGGLTIISPMDGTPAARAGLKALDKIVQIGEESTVNMNIEEAVTRLRGKPGTRVVISVLRPGWSEPRKFTLTRAIIKIESVTSELLSHDVGYIKIKSFQSNTYDDVSKHLDTLKAKTKNKLKGLVLDLRNNPGGLLDQAILISDLFIASGPLVITVGEGNKKREEKSATLSGTETDLPLAVITNGGSASASEIVAGALKNHNRAVIIGQQSFGKGSVQVLYDFKDQSALKLTIAQYLTPGDVSIQSIGITPDVLLYPGAIDKTGVQLFAHVDYPREKDLDKHLDRQNDQKGNTDAPPTETMNYLVERKSQPEDAGDEESSDASTDKFNEDYEIRFAREVVMKAVTPERKRMLDSAQSYFRKQSVELEEKITKAFAGVGVDWAAGKTPNRVETPVETKLVFAMAPVLPKGQAFKPTVASGAVLNDARVKAGDEVLLTATVKNNGSQELTRVYGVTQSDNPMFDKRELVFGKILPGETRTWALPIKVPKDMYARVDEVKLKLADLTHQGAQGRQVVTIDELPRPHFAYAWQVKDDGKGNGDGLVDAGEDVELVVSVKNIGKGAAQEAFLNLKNLNGDALYIEQGRAKLGAIAPGEEKEATLKFLAKNDAALSKTADLKLSVVDVALSEALAERLHFDLGEERQASKVETKRFNVRISADRTPLYAAASDKSDVLLHVAKGSSFKATAIVTSGGKPFYRVQQDKRSLFVSTAAAEVGNGSAAAKKQDTSFPHTTPDITIAEGIRGTHTTTPQVSVKGFATSGKPMRDVYIFVNDQKVFYRNAAKDDAQKDGTFKHGFETMLPLKVGTNTVTVVAREDEETTARQTFVLFREGETPVAAAPSNK